MYTTYVARQPILNAKRHTLGYELLFRDGEKNAFPEYMDADRATYRLIVENFLSLGTNPRIARSRCFINFPHKSLIRRLPLTLPREQIVVEILETCQPTDDLFEAVQELSQRGYLLALDDFVYSPAWERFLPYVQIVKIDIMAMGSIKRVNLCVVDWLREVVADFWQNESKPKMSFIKRVMRVLPSSKAIFQ